MATGPVARPEPPPEAPAALRLSTSLARVPPREVLPPVAAPAPAPVAATASPLSAPPATPPPAIHPAPAEPAPPPQSLPTSIAGISAALRNAANNSSPGMLPLTMGLGGIAVLTSLGWLMERRRRREEEDSVLWAGVQPAASSLVVTRVNTLDEILPDGPTAAESARAIYVTAIGETTSRREATLIDLHALNKRLQKRLKRGDRNAAVLLLQQHLVDFRYTSPWVFLELRELYLDLNLQDEWNIARDAFRARFGQNAPIWIAHSTAGSELLDDPQLCEGVSAHWPNRPTRMWMLRWLLGEHDMRIKSLGPPLLELGVYRDLMLLDRLLNEVMPQTTAYQDTV